MKILITFFPLSSYGGIINNQEGLYVGLKKLGHDVNVVLLEWKNKINAKASSRRMLAIKGQQGMYYDQDLGWIWPIEKRIPYKGTENIKHWKDFASKYDLIIWQVPVPTMSHVNFGNTDWLELYNLPVKQIVYIHDGNLRTRAGQPGYPWLVEIRKHLCGVAAVHPCAYYSVEGLGLPRALIFSPQMNINKRLNNTKYKDREAGFMSLQTFKIWKRVDELIRAIPHMTGVERKIVAGGGLYYHHMTSEKKGREKYRLTSRKWDFDIDKKYLGKPIWDVALLNGMEYIGYVHNKERDEILKKVRLLIDPSWSKYYSSIGDHPNRVVIDGIICGCVPVARNLGITTNEKGIGEFFKAGENYVMIPWNATPKRFGEIISDVVNMGKTRYESMLEAGRKLLPLYDYRTVAQSFIDLSKGKPTGVYENKGLCRYDPSLEKESQIFMETFFAGCEKGSFESNSTPQNILI